MNEETTTPIRPLQVQIGDDWQKPNVQIKTYGISVAYLDFRGRSVLHGNMIEIHGNKELRDEILAMLTSGTSAVSARRRVHHVKRGTNYTVQHEKGLLQTGQPLQDGDVLVTYIGDDGQVWHRPPHEFEDGRFAPAPPATADADWLDMPTTAATSFCNEQFVIDLCSFKGEMTHPLNADTANNLALDTRAWLHGLVQEHVQAAVAAHPVAEASAAPGELPPNCSFPRCDCNSDDKNENDYCWDQLKSSAAQGEAGESEEQVLDGLLQTVQRQLDDVSKHRGYAHYSQGALLLRKHLARRAVHEDRDGEEIGDDRQLAAGEDGPARDRELVRARLALPQGARLELIGGEATAAGADGLALGFGPADHAEGVVRFLVRKPSHPS